MTVHSQIEFLMDRYREPAILAWRPYPPVDLPEANSKLGGIPRLPQGTSWPRAKDNRPLHFLATIDCKELPLGHSMLPDKGTLHFFARIDEEMDWDDRSLEDHSRVLFFENEELVTAEVPSDLPAIMDGYNQYDKDFRLSEEPFSRTYPSWPLVFKNISSWPDASALRWPEQTPGLYDEYRQSVNRARAAELVRVTGYPINPTLHPDWGKFVFNSEGRQVISLPQTPCGRKFPQANIIAERVCRFLLNASEDVIQSEKEKIGSGGSTDAGQADTMQLFEHLERIKSTARSWIQRANAAGLNEGMSDDQCDEFLNWFSRLCEDPEFEIKYLVSRSLKAGLSSAVKYCGGDQSAASSIHPGLMNQLEGEHLPTSVDTYGIAVAAPRRWLSSRYHQMLGNAGASQMPQPVGGQDVLLLQLVSDEGVDFMFCDAGEIEFFVNAQDLLARRFDRVRARTAGG